MSTKKFVSKEKSRKAKLQSGSKKFNKISVKRATTGWEKNTSNKRGQFWVHVSDGYVYLSYARGRAYWMLRNIDVPDRPRIKASSGSQTIWINTFGIKFEKKSDYDFAVKRLVPWGKKIKVKKA